MSTVRSPTLAFAIELVRRQSITPDDAGCQELLAARLRPLGFAIERLRFGGVTNLWARFGSRPPLFVFAGHTDVVPPGPRDKWQFPPFAGVVDEGHLYGRGAADMKGSLAAMITACERFVVKHPHPSGSIAFLITSDEEGPAQDGTLRVIEYLQARHEHIDWCLIGEPSGKVIVADTLKNGRRGSLNAHLWVHGHQGHIAYPERVVNPIHRFAPALAELTTTVWDEGNAFFPPTSFQVSNLRAGIGADNVVPGVLEVQFNFRYSTVFTTAELQARVAAVLTRHELDYTIEWRPSGDPFLTPGGALLEASTRSVSEVLGIHCDVCTSGGTSDGRFIARTGAEVIELGPVNTTIHQVNERVRTEDLETLSHIYERIMQRLLGA
jgi:succinyl-diaminopimelate desuccinylase